MNKLEKAKLSAIFCSSTIKGNIHNHVKILFLSQYLLDKLNFTQRRKMMMMKMMMWKKEEEKREREIFSSSNLPLTWIF